MTKTTVDGTEYRTTSCRQGYYDADGSVVYRPGDLPEDFDRRTRYNDPLDHLADKDLTVSANGRTSHQPGLELVGLSLLLL